MAKVNPDQFKMFMSPREILGSVDELGDVGRISGESVMTRNETMRYKLADSRKSGLDQRIAKDGVKKPVDLFHYAGNTEMVNGHHRLATQYSQDPDRLMPVMHHDSYHTVDFSDVGADPTGDKPYNFDSSRRIVKRPAYSNPMR